MKQMCLLYFYLKILNELCFDARIGSIFRFADSQEMEIVVRLPYPRNLLRIRISTCQIVFSNKSYCMALAVGYWYI